MFTYPDAALAVVVTGLLAMLQTPRRRRLHNAVLSAGAVLGRTFDGSLEQRASAAIDGLLQRLENEDKRDGPVGSITRLPAQEALFVRMAADGSGTLAVLHLCDYDRLCAFDPKLADRVLLGIVGRIRAMLPAERLVAEVDRARLAIWFGPGTPSAQTELDALVYALGDRLIDNEREILPEIAMRSAQFDSANAEPQALLSQVLASFSRVATSAALPPASSACDDPSREDFLIEQDLRQAVARGELRLQFQPLIDADENRVCGAEALIRWQHPTRGLVSPGRFIPIMEAAGLSLEIGLWALNTALREARGWSLEGFEALRMAVNVSGRQLEVPNLPAAVARLLSQHGLDADALEIEITESVAVSDDAHAARTCAALRKQGVTIAIDDFGTGYSSLGAIRDLAFDKIKIDRSFVTDIDKRSDNQAICRAVLALGQGLGIRILAEGVETAAEYQWLRANGCRYFQGFYFARPLDGEAFRAFVRDRSALVHRLSSQEPHQQLPRLIA